jgi:hypothetical protein
VLNSTLPVPLIPDRAGYLPRFAPTKWKVDEPTNTCHPYTLGTPGPISPLVSPLSNPLPTSLDLFSRFFTEELWDLLVEETNRYAAENVGTTPGARPWSDTTVPEIKAFVGMLMHMGVLKAPRLELYWQKTYRELETPGLAEIMPIRRFQQIWRFFHISNNANMIPRGQPGYDKLYRVRPLLDIITPLFESEYVTHQNCAIDEAMIPYKGRLGFKQYMKDKPTKWGIKVFVLADSHNGYVKRLQVYTGKDVDAGSDAVGLCTRVCLELLNGLENSGLCLYTDNYYTSPVLCKHLYNNGINSCGTCKTARKFFPQDIVLKACVENRGKYNWKSNGAVLCTSWVDKKTVNYVSTFHPARLPIPLQPSMVQRTNELGTKLPVHCPPVQVDYQRYMRGVDRGDQLQTYYNLGRRSVKWWRRVFFYIVEVAVMNSYVLDRNVRPTDHAKVGWGKRDLYHFRLELTNLLIGGYRGAKRIGRPRSLHNAQLGRLTHSSRHWPLSVGTKGNCVVCLAKMNRQHLPTRHNRHESRVKCKECDVYLCVALGRDCFEKYHMVVDYSV